MPRRFVPPGARGHALILLASLGAAATSVESLAAPLSYDDARSTLHSVSDLRQSSEAGANRREYDARAADSLWLPEVFVNATEVFGVKTGSVAVPPLGSINISQNLRGPRSSINSTWQIYTGGRIEATQRALNAGAEEARAELAVTDERLDQRLAEVYFGLELAANIERTRASILEQADRQLDRAVRFEQRGLIAKVERLTAQVARDEAARELVRAQADRKIALQRLQRLLHRNVAIEPSTPLFVISGPIKPLTEWLATAESNPILAAFDARREQAQQGIAIAESRWKPEVFAFGSYSFMHNYQTLIEPNWIAGIGVNYTLFSREDRANKVSAAREALRQVQSLEEQTRNDIDTAVETSYQRVARAREEFLLLESQLDRSRESLRLRERGFEEGTATSLDVNDARNSVARAETSRAVAAYEFVVALADLLEASGRASTFSDYVRQADFQLRP